MKISSGRMPVARLIFSTIVDTNCCFHFHRSAVKNREPDIDHVVRALDPESIAVPKID